MKDKPFALIGVNSDRMERAKKAVEENKINWRSFQNAHPGRPEISEDWAVRGWPTIVVLDGDGTIRYRGRDGDAATVVAEELVSAMTKAK